MENLVAVLQGCSSNSRAERSAAEAALTQAQLSPGAAPALLRLAADTGAAGVAGQQVAQAAAIALKNLVKGRWVAGTAAAKEAASALAKAGMDPSSSSSGGGALPEADKAAVRDNLFEALALAPSPLVRSQLAEAVRAVAGHDFPAQWPGLAAAVAGALGPAARASPDQLLGAFLLGKQASSAPQAAAAASSSPESAALLQLPARVNAALIALRALCRQYEFRDRGEDGPLAALVLETFPQLLLVSRSAAALCGATTAKSAGGEGLMPPPPAANGHGADAASLPSPPSSPLDGAAPVAEQLGELVKLALKCFWSACYMGVPAAMMTATVAVVTPEAGGGQQQQQRQLVLIDGWLELIHDLVRNEVPLPFGVIPGCSKAFPDPLRDPEAAAEWPWWKARKWALHIASRLSSRYGDPRTFQPSAGRSGGSNSGEGGNGSRESAAAAAALERKFAEDWAGNGGGGGGSGAAGGGGVGERFLQAVLEGPLASAGAFFHAEAEAAAAGGGSGSGQPSPPTEQLLRRHWVSPRALNLALKHAERAIPLAAPWRALLKPHAAALVRAVALPAAAFDDADEELWEGDPAEFVRRANDVMVELYSPRAAAVNFVVSLCRQRTATALAPTLEALGAALQQHLMLQSSQQSRPSQSPTTRHVERRADGALLLAGSLADTLKRKRALARSQVEPLLRGVVLPLFASPRGHLRARACWVAGQFADAELSQQQAAGDSSSSTATAAALCSGTGPVFDALFDAVVASLRDPELPVRIDAAVALRSLVEAAASGGDDGEGSPGTMSAASRTDARVTAALPDLLRTLLQLMSQVDNEDLVSALEALVERAGPGVAPFAAELTRELVAAFNRMAPPPSVPSSSAEATANGGGLGNAGSASASSIATTTAFDTATKDTADDRDDDAAMAAFSVLRALLTIIDAVSGVPGAVQSIEPHLLPLVARLVGGTGGDEAPDVFEEGLDLLSFLTYHSPAISRELWGLWPETVEAFDSWAGEAYLENMEPPLSNLIRRDAATFVAGRNPKRGGRPFVEDLVAIAKVALLWEGGGDRGSSAAAAPGTPGGGSHDEDSSSEDDSDGDENDDDDFDTIDDFEEVIPAARLLSVALQASGALRRERVAAGAAAGGDAGAAAAAAAAAQELAPVDAALPAIVAIAVDRLQGLRKKPKVDKATGQVLVPERRGPQPPRPLREALLRVVADALSFDAAAALGAIGAATGAGAEGVAKFFEIWVTLATATKGEGKGKKKRSSSSDGGAAAATAPALENFRKAGDKKSAVLGLAAALAAPPSSLPPAVEAGAGHVLSAALGLLAAWKEQQRARGDEEEGQEGGGGGSRMLPGWGGGGAASDDDDGGGHGDDEDDDEDGDADVYVRRLAAAAARRAAKVAAGGGSDDSDDDDDSDDSDDGWGSSDDDDDFGGDESDSPLASVDPRAVLLASVNAARQLGRLAGIENDAGMRGALEALAAEVSS